TRRAAATIIGVMAGGTAGAVALGIPSAVVGAGVGAITGATIGTSLGGQGIAGAGIGAAVGGVGAGAAGAAVGAAIGGTTGGLLAYALGAGDPGANPDEPWRQNGPRHALPDADGPNQFEFHLTSEQARRSGLPAVDYVVNHRGDVDAKVGTSTFGWSGGQARSPYAVFGPHVEKSVRDWTRGHAESLRTAIPGSDIAWPSEDTGADAAER
ncbi:hypothetical protein GA0061091_1505, partial [Gordonia sp. v-85]